MTRLPPFARLLVLAYGAALFLWLSLEDNAVWPVALYGLVLMILITILTSLDKINLRVLSAGQRTLLLVSAGLVTGAGTAITTAALMFFKNALHAHIFVDFPPGMILAVLQRAPLWGLAGLCAGLGVALVWMAWHR